jgi:hypothetical protein
MQFKVVLHFGCAAIIEFGWMKTILAASDKKVHPWCQGLIGWTLIDIPIFNL